MLVIGSPALHLLTGSWAAVGEWDHRVGSSQDS
jgi:hypothetical protein